MAAGPRYYLQLCDEAGTPITSPFRPVRHRHGTVDIPLIERCVEEIVKHGVGVGRTEAHVRRAIVAGMQAAIQSLKDDGRDLMGHS